MITCFVDENQENWDLGLNQLMFAYNSSVHQTTKQTPFMMVYGRAPRIPKDVIYGFEKEYERECSKLTSNSTGNKYQCCQT